MLSSTTARRPALLLCLYLYNKLLKCVCAIMTSCLWGLFKNPIKNTGTYTVNVILSVHCATVTESLLLETQWTNRVSCVLMLSLWMTKTRFNTNDNQGDNQTFPSWCILACGHLQCLLEVEKNKEWRFLTNLQTNVQAQTIIMDIHSNCHTLLVYWCESNVYVYIRYTKFPLKPVADAFLRPDAYFLLPTAMLEC